MHACTCLVLSVSQLYMHWIQQGHTQAMLLVKPSYKRFVTIDDRRMEINYGMREVFKDLMIESAWEACTNSVRLDCVTRCKFF